MADIILTANMFKDLENTLGERNKVTMVNGKEYRIDKSNTITIEPGSKELSFSTPQSVYVFAYVDAYNIFRHHWYSREEACVTSGSFTFEYTPTVESFDLNTIVTSYEIFYKKYHRNSDLINSGNYQSYSNVFKGIKSDSNLQTGGEDYDEETKCYKTTGVIPHDKSHIKNWLGQDSSNSTIYLPSQYVNVSFLKREYNADTQQTTYYFRASYRFVTATGHNVYNNRFIVSNLNDNYYNEVQKVKIEIKACSVQTEEVDKSVGGGSQKIELKTNELMQTPMTNATSLFDITANQIIDAYSTNRTLVTLKLLKVEKYTFEDGTTRVLRAGDKVKIKNNQDKFVGEYTKKSGNDIVIDGNYFEIIKLKNCYDGFFYKQLTLREVLRTDQ